MCIHLITYTWTYAYAHAHAHHAHAYTHTRMHTHTHTHTHIRMHTCIRMHTHAHTRLHAPARTQTHTHTRKHTHTHACMHMHVRTYHCSARSCVPQRRSPGARLRRRFAPRTYLYIQYAVTYGASLLRRDGDTFLACSRRLLVEWQQWYIGTRNTQHECSSSTYCTLHVLVLASKSQSCDFVLCQKHMSSHLSIHGEEGRGGIPLSEYSLDLRTGGPKRAATAKN